MRRNRSRGAALLVAMLTVTLVATLAAASLWQQWRSVEVEGADRQRVQSEWILTGALDWARLILREDAIADSRSGNQVDHLAEPWAVPLQEARLSTFLAADTTTGTMDYGSDADNVFLSGDITDLQSKLNVTSMVQSGKLVDANVDAFRRLFDVLGLPQAELTRMTENLRFASDINIDNLNAARASLLPQRVEQLAWLGLSPETVAALQPYVTVLPEPITPVNLNTAPAEVIYAVGSNLGLADAQRLVAERERQYFRSMADVSSRLPDAKFQNTIAGFSSRYFQVVGRLRIDNVVIEERSMVRRNGSNVETILRERGASETTAPRLTQR